MIIIKGCILSWVAGASEEGPVGPRRSEFEFNSIFFFALKAEETSNNKPSRFRLTNVSVRAPSENGGASSGHNLQLTATKSTRMEPLPTPSNPVCGQSKWKRTITSIQEIVEEPDFNPSFNEVDTVGVVVKAGKQELGKNSQEVYICDTMTPQV